LQMSRGIGMTELVQEISAAVGAAGVAVGLDLPIGQFMLTMQWQQFSLPTPGQLLRDFDVRSVDIIRFKAEKPPIVWQGMFAIVAVTCFKEGIEKECIETLPTG
jgi:hypothetical protein